MTFEQWFATYWPDFDKAQAFRAWEQAVRDAMALFDKARCKAMTYSYKLIRIGEDGEPELQVGPGDDGIGVRITTPDDESREHWGVIDMTLSNDFALKLGEALIEMGKAKP